MGCNDEGPVAHAQIAHRYATRADEVHMQVILFMFGITHHKLYASYFDFA